jgi:3D (Asp-Asp-Asp) domain-containing protein
MRRAHPAPCLVLLSILIGVFVIGCSSSRSTARLDPVPDSQRLALSDALGSDLFETPDAPPTVLRIAPPAPSHRRLPRFNGLVGIASFYHSALNGRTTANGDVYDEQKLTAASRTLALGTRVRVTNLGNRRSVVVTVNDRGPYVGGRIIDLSRRAARALDFEDQGTTRVRVVPL